MSDERCYYHLKSNPLDASVGAEILQIGCPKCGYHRVVVICASCFGSIDYLVTNGNLKSRCEECNELISMKERWTLLGKA